MLKTSGLHHGRWPSWIWPLIFQQTALFSLKKKRGGGDSQVLVQEALASKPGFKIREKICPVSPCHDVGCMLGIGPLGWEGTILSSKVSILLGSRAQGREERLRQKRQDGW